MDEAASYLIRHGYAVLFVWVTAEQFALPVPSEPVLLAAGALARAGRLTLPVAVLVAVAGALVADVVWYEIGRTRGSRVLRFLCRISLERDSCVRQSQERFARHGARALLVAKFVPGLNTVAQPLAGILGVPRRRFLLFDGLGAMLWVGSYMTLGYVFGDQLERLALYGDRLGTWLIVLLLATYVFDMPPVWAGVAVLFASCPSGINAYLFAERYGEGVALASSTVTLSTILALGTTLIWLYVLGIG